MAALARAPIDAVLALWSGLGYYRRAHHLHAAAKAVVAEHGGAFPRDAATLATLPGVGRSTAAAIAALAFGAHRGDPRRQREARARASSRHCRMAGRAEGRGRAVERSRRAALPCADVDAYTQGLMDLGATLCTRANPRCDACPVAADCVARRDGRVGELPEPRPRKALPQRAIRVLLIERCGEILFEKRPDVGIWGGLWSLPECALADDVEATVRQRFGAQSKSATRCRRSRTGSRTSR